MDMSHIKKTNYSPVLIGLLVTIIGLSGCRNADPTEEIILFWQAESSPNAGNPLYFTLYFNGKNTLATWNDYPTNLYNIEWQLLDMSNLLFEESTFIERLVYTTYEDDLLIFFASSNDEYSGSRIARIDGQSLQPIWVTDFAFFNIGDPVIKANKLYVTAIGAVGKVDVASGAFVWKHTDLYNRETQDFTAFETPMFSGDTIIFQGTNIFSACPQRIVVRDQDGEILSFEDTCL